MSAIASERLSEVFVELADTLVDDFDLVEFLQMLTSRVSELTGARAAGLMLADAEDRLHFMAASDERVHLLDLFQIQTDEGPCRDCFRQGAAVSAADLRRAETRWPRFAPAALQAGFASVQAFPLRLRQQVIGSVGLFGASAVAMAPADVRVVQALVDVATIGILQERQVRRGQVLTEQLQGALNSRIVIEQAKGVIAQARAVTIDEAFTMLRTYCRTHHLRLSETARLIVSDPAQMPNFETD
ncbi:GAF and ANTAR domain-containing protein [Kineosporia rhizophila]|uniref:GAF and ANTAR domain-containing protein n=1 Tax=Kineosporia TaxID=49184 RepID=UPI001E346C53|nr:MULTISPECIES: GAF and ANTAR domain-containing protein [Kineosporia]MCE0539657.1 GAF and ANTAR domain-containing protein [Kineosporia rhizophila]GLY17915.1 transcriptional regulator [Kineosporia sp. NBRC 101677]